MTNRYDDIIDLPHPEPTAHPRMTMRERAAQFAPFAALTDHHAAIAETGRWTGERVDLTASEVERLNEILMEIETLLPHSVTVTHFQPDKRKDGGVYVTTTGTVRKIDPIKGVLQFEDKQEVALDEITEILIN